MPAMTHTFSEGSHLDKACDTAGNLADLSLFGFIQTPAQLSGAAQDVITGPDGNLWMTEDPKLIGRYLLQ